MHKISHCLAYIMHESVKKWTKNLLFRKCFKNEAFNQKSGTVKLLGYVWTCFPELGGVGKWKLRMPRALALLLERPYFQLSHNFSKRKVVFEVKKSIFKKLLKMCLWCQNWLLNTSGVSQSGLRSISDMFNTLEAIFQKSKFWLFFRIFSLLFGLFYS